MSYLEDLALQLWEAQKTKKPLSPLSESYPDLTIDQAYQVQWKNVARFLAEKHGIVGYKVGLTSEAAQKHLGIEHPDLGHLYDNYSLLDGSIVSCKNLIAPQIEPEVAFLLRKGLQGPGVNAAQALDAVEYVYPALEIVDTRIADWKIRAQDSIADNASSALFVLGEYRARPFDISLDNIPVSFSQNGEVRLTGNSKAVMGNPIHALVYLANELGRLGKALKPGEIVLSGSITAMLKVKAEDFFQCDMGVLGKVSLGFRH